MQILYLSTLVSNRLIRIVQQNDPTFSSYAAQKFNRLIVQGFVQNGADVTAISTFSGSNTFAIGRIKDEIEDGVMYKYITSIKLGMVRHIWLFLFCFFYVFRWGFCQNKSDRVLVCDVLNVSACLGALVASRIVGLKSVGIMTDLPGLMVGNERYFKKKKRFNFYVTLNEISLKGYTHFVFLTEQMNTLINTSNRPYVIMEGLVDANLRLPEQKVFDSPRVILYAGGLHERYGIKALVEGFILADIPNTELWLFGEGPFSKTLSKYCKCDSRIRYWGLKPNNVIVEAEMMATLLVNPRPTHEDFTRYSFPSKNMEYMASGTPLLTTKLPGMPEEYLPHVFLFERENADGYAKALRDVLSYSDSELKKKGLEAREWVLQNKNHVLQSKRILDLLTQ